MTSDELLRSLREKTEHQRELFAAIEILRTFMLDMDTRISKLEIEMKKLSRPH